MKIVKTLDDSGLLIQGITQTIQNETKKQRGGYRGILSSSLGASLLGNMLADKVVEAIVHGKLRAGLGILRAGFETSPEQDFKCRLIL